MATPSAIATKHLAVLTDIRDRLVRVEAKLDDVLAARGTPSEPTPDLPPLPAPKHLGQNLARKGS